MPKNTAECGKREERAIVKDLTARGYRARRQPGSGSVDPTLPHDVVWEDSPIGRLLLEAKWRANCGWKTLIKWMEGAPILVLKSSGSGTNQHQSVGPEGKRYVFMTWDTFMALVGDAAQRAEAADLGAQIATPDKPWIEEPKMITIDNPSYAEFLQKQAWQRQQIQDFPLPEPSKSPKPRKGFGKPVK